MLLCSVPRLTWAQSEADAPVQATQKDPEPKPEPDEKARRKEERAQKGQIHDFVFLPLPIIATNPASGWMFGLAPSANWMMGPKETTRRSSLVSSVIYTTKQQLMFLVKFNQFLKDDQWNLLGDWRYFNTSQPTYGAGTGPESSTLASNGFEYEDGSYSSGIDQAQMMEFKYVRFHQTVLRRIHRTHFFAGLGYHLDYHFDIDDQLLDLESEPPVITSHYAYSVSRDFDPDKYMLSGVSVNGLYDSRDNPINPYQGRYGFLSVRMNPKFLGSSKNSGLLWAEYRDYFGLQKKRPRHLIAVWAYGSFALGDDVPYMDLPALGWDFFGRSGRGYPQGRFRGQELLYAEVEYRFPFPGHGLWERFGGVLFANATTATNRDANTYLFKYVAPAGGGGLRLMFNKKSRANLTIDYGAGLYGSHGFYLNANETF